MFPQLHTWEEIRVPKTTQELKPAGGAHRTELPQAPQEAMSCPGPQFPAAAVTNGHKPGAYNNRNSSSHTLEARSPRSGHCRATLPPEAPREGPSLDLVASGGPRHPWLVAASLPLSSHGFCLLSVSSPLLSQISLSFLLQRHLSLDSGPIQVIQGDRISRPLA